MQRSVDRILTTHTGSLPRPPDLLPALLASDPTRVDRNRVEAAVQEAVGRQVAAGIDIVSDGEMSKPGFAHYVTARLTGFGGTAAPRPFAPADLRDYPDVAQRLFSDGGDARPRPPMPTNDGPIAYVGWEL